MSDPAIWIDPGRMSGQPCLYGHRLPVEHVATNISFYSGSSFHSDSVSAYMDAYGIDAGERRNVICCAAYWVLNSKGGPRWMREIRTAWKSWAETTWEAAWHMDDELTAPPALAVRGSS